MVAPPAALGSASVVGAAKPTGAASRLRSAGTALAVAASFAGLAWMGEHAPQRFLAHFSIFVLACIVGWLVVWRVTPALHTPLMSVTNAISGIILIGAMHQLSGSLGSTISLLAAAAVLLASINVVGGFWVTQRMFRMFQR